MTATVLEGDPANEFDRAVEAARVADEAAKLKANRAQLEAEEEARRRRIALRKGAAARRLAQRQEVAKRRKVRMAAVWGTMFAALFVGAALYSGHLVALFDRLVAPV